MASLVLTAVRATPALATRNSAGTLIPPGVPLTVWDPAGNYADCGGSTKPVTFRTPVDATQPYSPSFTLIATCTFTSQYAGQSFDVEVSLPIGPNGAFVTILRSTGNMPPMPLPNPPVPVPLQISNFQFNNGLNLASGCPVPFRFAGDFQWKLTFMALPGKYWPR
jgi:hypothetical protein